MEQREVAKEIEEMSNYIVNTLGVKDFKIVNMMIFYTYVPPRGRKMIRLRPLEESEKFYLKLAGYYKDLVLEVRRDSWDKLSKEEKMKRLLREILRVKIEKRKDKVVVRILDDGKVDGSFDYYWQMLKNEIKYFCEENKMKGKCIVVKHGKYYGVYLDKRYRDQIAHTYAKFCKQLEFWSYSDKYISLFFKEEDVANQCKKLFIKLTSKPVSRDEDLRGQQGEESAPQTGEDT